MPQRFSLFSVILFAMASFSGNAGDFSCDSSAGCNKLGSQAYKKGHFADAAWYFGMQVSYAELLGSKAALTAYNNVALAEYKAGKCLTPLAWLRVASDHKKLFGEKDEATQHNLKLIEKACMQKPLPTSVEGRYERYGGFGNWEKIKVWPEKNNQIRYELELCRMGSDPDSGCLGIGEASGSGTLKNSLAKVSYQSDFDKICYLSIRFKPNKLEITQTNTELECGFGGAGVSPDGEYSRMD